MENSVIGFAFVNHVDAQSKPVISDVKEFLKEAYVRHSSGINNLIRFGEYKSMGYLYNLKPFLKNSFINNMGIG